MTTYKVKINKGYSHVSYLYGKTLWEALAFCKYYNAYSIESVKTNQPK